MILPGLYLITDRRLCPGEDLPASIRPALQAGVRLVQLREKDLNAGELLRLALELRALTASFGARLLINDRVDVALVSGADGVHLGQKSVSPKDARRIAKKGFVIGVSAHGLEEARRAADEGADFITLGPIYSTPSKAAYGAPLGAGLLREVRKRVDIPVYAVGGIKKEMIREVMSAGADGAAVISAVLGSRDAGKSAGELIREITNYQKEHI